ncbi:MAG: HAMP domain-containing protein [Planctomycetota bacterium]|nr:MAG: HAMP domain-containing protein [Planctomycetota bacterium]
MMSVDRPRTIQRKITGVVMATTGVALLLSTAALLVDQYLSHREETANRLRITARIVAAQSSAAVVFKDGRAAEEIMSSLRAEEDLVAATIYTTEGNLFVRYLRADARPDDLPAGPRQDGSGFHGGVFELFEPILVDGKTMGTFYLRSDLGRLRMRLGWNMLIAFSVLAATSLAAVFLATRLLSLVTRPILRLERMANKVTIQRDYSVRAPEESADEVGRLVRAFNEMLAQIQIRDDALRKAQTELEERVQARTTALQEALRELESFTYTISHDLRAPLRAMAGFSRMLIEDYGHRLDPAGREYIDRISAGARRMDDLIQDLLAYSRLTRQEVKIERIDLDVLLEEVLIEMQEEIVERRAKIEVDRPLPVVMGHPLTLHQALTNLLANAIKFVAPGAEPHVRIVSSRRDGTVRIQVEDNGIGIAPEYHERIFRIFERLNPAGDFPGTGIGLAIARRTMARMGGRSGVESEVGRGSRFWIELPLP